MPGYSLVPELQAELPATPSGLKNRAHEVRRESGWEIREKVEEKE